MFVMNPPEIIPHGRVDILLVCLLKTVQTKNDFMNLTLEQKILAGAFNPINMTKKKKEESVLAI